MSQTAITIGSKVRVLRVRDRIPADLVDYRVTDGKGIGVVVDLAGGGSTWFFEDEIAPA
jgi:hypothetical protein